MSYKNMIFFVTRRHHTAAMWALFPVFVNILREIMKLYAKRGKESVRPSQNERPFRAPALYERDVISRKP